MYDIKKKSTAPQGLLLAAVILMFSILALNMEITTLAPNYASFGSQMYRNTTTGEVKSCSLNAPPSLCTMTEIGKKIFNEEKKFGIFF
jgi:LMBR1 domain-containing protein 1